MLAGCGCGSLEPQWLTIDDVYLAGQVQTIDLAPYATDDRSGLEFTVDYPQGLVAEIDGSMLTITPESDFRDQVVLDLTVTDACGNTAVTQLTVHAGQGVPTGPASSCATTFTYWPQGSPDSVAVAGEFNDWAIDVDLLQSNGDGSWSVDIDLAPGPYAYKFVEVGGGAFEPTQGWTCDPNAELISCDPGYKEPWETDWSHTCGVGIDSCNSVVVVPDCAVPTLDVQVVDYSEDTQRLHIEVAAESVNPIASATATLDGVEIDGAFDGQKFVIDTAVDAGRHTARFTVTDDQGNTSEFAHVPLWTDGFDDAADVLYFAFVDRLADGDTTLNVDEGTDAVLGGYEGGDVQGLIDVLPYLDDLGVTTLWLSNLQGNTEGAWAGDCGRTYAGYHAYWPDAGRDPEEHFGDEALIHQLVDEAHDRGMRVIMDWVANHVHETHPYYADHPEWFNQDGVCRDSVNGQQNWDRIPESCAFAPYLPDIDYAQPDAMKAMLDDALWWAKNYDLDGFRVDAVKHMPHAVTYNLQSRVKRELEHVEAGSPMAFYTVGETFDSYDRIKAYIGDDQLDGQFDFDLYYAIRSAFLHHENGGLSGVYQAWNTSQTVYGDAPMSTFLGNHDVLRFMSEGAEGWVGACQDGQIVPAPEVTDPWPYQSLRLAWSFLFTMPGRPLVYYGDEIGMPGRGDPDNRQPLWWYTGGHEGMTSVDAMANRVDAEQAATVRHVQALAQARRDHPALYSGSWIQWWDEYDLYAVGRSAGNDHAIVILNRSQDPRTLTNGVAFAGLPEGTYTDVLTGQTFTASGDSITVDVPARGSRVLVYTP